jgi:DNA-directed RNA polymerase subunit M/transcription elongation factor TFIIS
MNFYCPNCGTLLTATKQVIACFNCKSRIDTNYLDKELVVDFNYLEDKKKETKH